MAQSSFSMGGFLVRWIGALVLVFATFNPEFSFYQWVTGAIGGPPGENMPVKVIVGILLLIGYVIFLRATWRSVGVVGVVLICALFGAIIWALFYYGLMDLTQTTALTYVALVALATVLAIGMSWSHVRRRMSGQADVDDVDE